MTGTDERLQAKLSPLAVPEPEAGARARAVEGALAEFDRRARKKRQGFFSFGRHTGQKPKGGPVMNRPFAIATSLALAVSALIAIAVPNFMSYRTAGPGRVESTGVGRMPPPQSPVREADKVTLQADDESAAGIAKPSENLPQSVDAPAASPASAPAPGRKSTATAAPKPAPKNEVLSTGEKQRVAVEERRAKIAKFKTAAPAVDGKRPIAPPVQTPSPSMAESELLPMPPPGPADTGRDRFESVAPNPLRRVVEAPVSTFSIDVDTASYAFVRRALNNGVLPQKNAVRIEELINYFDYDYPLPETRVAPFRPTVSVFPTPWNPHTKLVHIGLKGHRIIPDQQPRANLVFLVDVSGSMRGPDRLPLLKNALRMLVSTLQPDDTVAIVVYAGAAGVVLEPTPVRQSGRILNALGRLRSGGSTAGGAGIRLAYDLARAHFDPEGVNRVILATDGDFNVGIRNPGALKGFVERQRQTGIYLSVLGFGQGNYNDALMQALAQNGNGNAAYIDTLNEARKVLVDEATATLFPIAKDVKIQVEFNPAMVAEYRLIGYETRMLRREDFNNDRIDAGEVGSGHSVTAIYEITPVDSPATLVDDLRYGATPHSQAGPQPASPEEYAFLKLRYKLPEAHRSRKLTTPITPAHEAPTVATAPAEAQFAAAVAAFGLILRGDSLVGDFTYADVHRLAQPVRGEDPFGYRAEFLNLVRLAQTARGMGQ
jgi:Ca-activated chloride channel family protein